MMMPSIILVRPQMGENIGAAVRGMANFGLSDLRLVDPRDGWPNEKAVSMAAGAFDQMPDPQIFSSMAEATADLNYTYATTARRRDLFKDVCLPDQAAQDLAKRTQNENRTGFVFGAERTGLTNEDLSYCHGLVTIPTAPEFSSLNLGQSVLLLAYEWSKYAQDGEQEDLNSDDPRAVQRDVNHLLSRLEEELEAHNFFRTPDLRAGTLETIRNLFLRAEMYDQEVRTMQGVLSALIGNKKQP